MSRVTDLQQGWLQDPAYAFDFASMRKALEQPARARPRRSKTVAVSPRRAPATGATHASRDEDAGRP